MLKRFNSVLAATLAGVFALTASVTVSAAEDHPAQTLVVESITAMLDVLENDGEKIAADPNYLQSKVDELIVPNLDFDTMTKLAVGKFWRRADAEQKVELVEQFQMMLLNTYTSYLGEFSGETITFEPFRAEEREDRAVVRSTFSQPSGNDVPVIYKLRERNGWSIYDIEGNIGGTVLSLVTSFRSAFASEIDRGGIAGLIETLKKRNATS